MRPRVDPRRRAEPDPWLRPIQPARLGRLPVPEPRLPLERRLSFRVSPPMVLVGAVAPVILFVIVSWFWSSTRVDADYEGIEDGAALTVEEASALDLAVTLSPGGRWDDTKVVFRRHASDDVPGDEGMEKELVEGKTRRMSIEGDTLRFRPGALQPGDYQLSMTVPRPMLPASTVDLRFTVDGTPPHVLTPPFLPAHDPEEDVTIEGTVEDADEFFVDGEAHDLGDGGRFSIHLDAPPPGPVELLARDEAGNEREVHVVVPIPYPEVHGVHVTAPAWADAGMRQHILDLIDAGAIDTVVMTLKDEGGRVGHHTQVPMANEIGASDELYDLKRQVDFLHDKGVRVIGRLVAFRDPTLANWAWETGKRDMVIQSPDGGRLAIYGGGFTSFAHSVVREYNIALAVEAAEAGVDDVMYDYVRRPDGLMKDMRIPHLEGPPEREIVTFLSDSHRRLRELGAMQGAAVFGIAATRPEQIGQNILLMAENTDYIAPMLYPSHWRGGEYGLPDPEAAPYEILKRSLRSFEQQVTRTGRPLVPWIQHFSLGRTYGTEEIVAQTEGARDAGWGSWLMWDAGVSYDRQALLQSRR